MTWLAMALIARRVVLSRRRVHRYVASAQRVCPRTRAVRSPTRWGRFWCSSDSPSIRDSSVNLLRILIVLALDLHAESRDLTRDPSGGSPVRLAARNEGIIMTLEIPLLVVLVMTAAGAILVKDLVSAVFILGSYSFTLALVWSLARCRRRGLRRGGRGRRPRYRVLPVDALRNVAEGHRHPPPADAVVRVRRPAAARGLCFSMGPTTCRGSATPTRPRAPTCPRSIWRGVSRTLTRPTW